MDLNDFPHHYETDTETEMSYLTIRTTCGPIVFSTPSANAKSLKHIANSRIQTLKLRPEGYHESA